jgi:hypothetical protein
LWLRKKKVIENKTKERRRQGPKYAKMRMEFDLDREKTKTSEALRSAQASMPAVDLKIENLRRIARLGRLKKL